MNLKNSYEIDESIYRRFEEKNNILYRRLWDKSLAAKIANDKFTKTIAKEAKIPVVGFYNLPRLTKKYRLKQLKQEEIIKKLKNYKVAITHFAP